MLRTVCIVLCWSLGLLFGSCSDDHIVFSADDVQEEVVEEPIHDTTAGAAQAADPDKEPGVVTETIAAPEQWPQCWLSSRLSSAEAVRKKVQVAYQKNDGRQEFRGNIVNPTAQGDCIYNWFGQDNSGEPWVALLHTRLSSFTSADYYEAVATCTADATPDCTCMTAIPIDSSITSGKPFIVGYCERENALGETKLFNVSAPDPATPMQPANGRCDTANNLIAEATKPEKRNEIFDMSEDGDIDVGNNQTCNVDVEPFNPRDDEKDWYADAIRDWAVVVCEDKQTSCRSYAIFYKSSEDQDARSPTPESGLMLICNDGSCQRAADN